MLFHSPIRLHVRVNARIVSESIIRGLAHLVYSTPSEGMDRLRALEIAPQARPRDNCQIPLTLVNDG